MTVISLTFPSGRYHATPWDRHVNEGAVEWPPSPWRILRALVATWKRTLPDLGQDEVEPVLRKLAGTLPEFSLPHASTGHSRHYMPWYKKGPDDRTLVFDTFVALDRDARVIVHWPGVTLDGRETEVFMSILNNLNALGRAESWCEATLLSEEKPPKVNGRGVAAPAGPAQTPTDREIVRLLCPDPPTAFDSVAFIDRSKRKPKRTAPLYDPDWHLCAETLWLHKQRWSDPPGSRWIQYSRPRDCFKAERTTQHPPGKWPRARPQVVRFALDSSVLPLVTETLAVGEAVRRALIWRGVDILGRMQYEGQWSRELHKAGQQPVDLKPLRRLTGKESNEQPLQGHGHAYYLPTDEDEDGRLDHLTLVSRDGFGPEEMRASGRLSLIRPRGRDNSHPLRVLLLGYGRLDEYQPPLLNPSTDWVSATPYIATRMPREHGRYRAEDARFWRERSAEERRAAQNAGRSLRRRVLADPCGWLESNLRGQLRDVVGLASDVLDQTTITPQHEEGAFKVAGRWRPIQFTRFRSKPGDYGWRRLSGAFRIRFPLEMRGPVALGWSSHFGMGLFVPAIDGVR